MVWKPIYMEMRDWVTWAPWGWWTLTGWDTAIQVSWKFMCLYFKILEYICGEWNVKKTHSSILAWRISGTEEPGGLLSMGSYRAGHVWSDLAAASTAAAMYLQSLPVWKPKLGPSSELPKVLVHLNSLNSVWKWMKDLAKTGLRGF